MLMQMPGLDMDDIAPNGGKRDEDLILPINSSLSVTLHQEQLKTTTTVAISRSFKEDRLWLNGKEEDISHPRLQSCLREIRRLARKRRSERNPRSTESVGLSHKVHICSVNNFPTAAGLASSAAGYACLVYTLAQAFGVEGELSGIARQGSGSACRSMYGGFVQWIMGSKEDGKDSVAQQVEPESHWPELRVLVLVASAERKPIGSTSGMQTSVQTSLLLKHRAEAIVPHRMVDMIEAVRRKDFPAFAELTMKESNQLHATCLDTHPPIFYLNSVSQHIIHLVHRYNKYYGETRVAYSFDAGPNAVIFALQQFVPEFVQLVQHFFPPDRNGEDFIKGLPVKSAALTVELKQSIGLEPLPKGVNYIISTKAGPGPLVVEDPSQHLLSAEGLPKKMV
ncbi:PREDICTED: diphosphomevalonate decarboxylase isoform X2 [Cyprinodon variegatus]|uniref:diphosphomevalonate decarboxylase isoform X2 n=1 Tax=Cyprinodon variegatus TaxID=28743 RepID=UPI0007424E53|nr:PREDICTED: diphosphomevalonate decarboxylase isoform X2 [Cyprinodon variegatus]